MMETGLCEQVIESIDWSQYEMMNSSAIALREHLRELIRCENQERLQELWWTTLENHVFSADDVFSAAEPTIQVALAAVADGISGPALFSILDLLFHLVHASFLSDSSLTRRCQREAVKGIWLLARLTKNSGTERGLALEVLKAFPPREVASIVGIPKRENPL